MEKYAKRVLRGDLSDLTEMDAFLRWFGRFAYPALRQDFPVNNGSNLAEFMGRRQLVNQIIDEMELEFPGFLRRLLEARDRYEQDLLAYGQQKEK